MEGHLKKRLILVLLMLVSMNLRGTMIPARSVQMEPQPVETAPAVAVLPDPFLLETDGEGREEPKAELDGPEKPEEAQKEDLVRTVDPNRPMVALTFDDGPHPIYTDQILDILEENGAIATFFEVGKKLSDAPGAVRRAEELGCEIGSHSYRHANLGRLDAKALKSDLTAADEAFLEVLGTVPALLRPPYGAIGETLRKNTDRTIVTWSVDPQDWKLRDAEQVVARVQGVRNLDR